ncbi:hypothetical protein ACTG16_23865 [Aeromonas sp. 23P]|uniref:hypothetical protein n=1 Tax=Aeromonas sp. 23P TaxID=3452716 RepID=UPI003F795383|nr:hypothetical protein [Aeromonas veronii]
MKPVAKNTKSASEHIRCMTTVEAVFCDFIKKTKAAGDHETILNVFAMYGQRMCPELSPDASIRVAKSRYDYLIGEKSEIEWFDVLKNEVFELAGKRVSIGCEIVDLDYLFKNELDNDEQVFKRGALIYDILTKNKATQDGIVMVKDDHSREMYSVLYLARNNEGDGYNVGPEEYRTNMESFFKSIGEKRTDLSQVKDNLLKSVDLMYSTLADGGFIGKQMVEAESNKCDSQSAITKANVFKTQADKCLFLSYIAHAIGVESENIKEMPYRHAEMSGRAKKVIRSANASFEM